MLRTMLLEGLLGFENDGTRAACPLACFVVRNMLDDAGASGSMADLPARSLAEHVAQRTRETVDAFCTRARRGGWHLRLWHCI